MGKKPRIQAQTTLAEAPSINKNEVFKATPTGLLRIRTQELRDGGKLRKVDELPYWRISSITYGEKVLKRGSLLLTIAGVLIVLFGLGTPVALSLRTIQDMISPYFPSGNPIAIRNAFLIPGVALMLSGTFMIATRFPRKIRDGWWQLNGLTGNDLFGWQVTANEKTVDNFVNVVKQKIALSKNSAATAKP